MSDETVVAGILAQHVGKAHAIVASDIAKLAGIEDGGGSPVTRNVIAELVRQGHPIAACSQGYFLASTDDEAVEYKLSLEQRARETVERLHSFNRAWASRQHPVKQESLVRWVPEPEEEACHL